VAVDTIGDGKLPVDGAEQADSQPGQTARQVLIGWGLRRSLSISQLQSVHTNAV
jgi:hypothetical protein